MRRCARCYGKLGDRYVYSRFTGLRYCVDFAGCDRRQQTRLNANHRRELEVLGREEPRRATAAARGSQESHAAPSGASSGRGAPSSLPNTPKERL